MTIKCSQLCVIVSFSIVNGTNCTFYIKFELISSIIKFNECLVTKNLLMNITKTNEHLNVTTFFSALMHARTHTHTHTHTHIHVNTEIHSYRHAQKTCRKVHALNFTR